MVAVCRNVQNVPAEKYIFILQLCAFYACKKQTKFEDGLKKTIQWYLDNEDWWQPIVSGEYMDYYEKMYGDR